MQQLDLSLMQINTIRHRDDELSQAFSEVSVPEPTVHLAGGKSPSSSCAMISKGIATSWEAHAPYLAVPRQEVSHEKSGSTGH